MTHTQRAWQRCSWRGFFHSGWDNDILLFRVGLQSTSQTRHRRLPSRRAGVAGGH